MGATSIVENKVGGGAGLIGTNEVINAAPDGYTFLASAFNTAVMPKVLKAATFNPEVDLEAVARTAVAPLCAGDFRQAPGKDSLRNSSNLRRESEGFQLRDLLAGSAGHLATVDFLRRTGLDINLIPYRGTVPALQDLIGGSVQLQLLIDRPSRCCRKRRMARRCARSVLPARRAQFSRRMCRPFPKAACPISCSIPGMASGRPKARLSPFRRRSTPWSRPR